MKSGDLVKIKNTETVGILLEDPQMYGFILRVWILIPGPDGLTLHEWVDIEDLVVLSKGKLDENW